MAIVSVVILNYNGRDYLEKFLPSVIQNSPDAQIIVADNCSTDDSVSLLRSEFPSIQLIELKENNGYAGGYNLALKQVESEYYMLLNSDVEVTSDWLDSMVDFLQQNPSYAAVQPKILDYKHKDYFEYAGASGGFVDRLGYPYCRGRIFDEVEKDLEQYNETTDVFWCSGACLLIRANVFHDLSGFDADFFAHMEEIDLCWRIKNKGFKLACVPESHVYHVGGGTLDKTKPNKTYLNFRNNLIMLAKNLSWEKALFFIPIRMVLDLVAGIKFWKDQSFQHFIAILRAQLHFILSLTKTYKKRKETRRNLLGKNFLLIQYYLMGKKTFKEINNTK
ncbi:MAG: glycosyltransferase family 2 protein [Cyclobacteriaceae bacterium]